MKKEKNSEEEFIDKLVDDLLDDELVGDISELDNEEQQLNKEFEEGSGELEELEDIENKKQIEGEKETVNNIESNIEVEDPTLTIIEEEEEEKDFTNEIKEFLDVNEDLLEEAKNEGRKSVVFDFRDIVEFNIELASNLLEKPTSIIEQFEKTLKEKGYDLKFRLKNIPESHNVQISKIRSDHISKLIVVEGIVRKASDVRPMAKRIIFICPTCHRRLIVPQTDIKIKEPEACVCGRKRGFKVQKIDFVDSQRVIIEEPPELIEHTQPQRIAAMLYYDLTDPKFEKLVAPGKRIRISGIVREVFIHLPSGGKSTRFDLNIEAINIEPVEEDYEDIKVSEEDIIKIKQIASDPEVYKKLVSSIAPSIYGYDEIKLALALQLFGGYKKIAPDGTKVRGDIHILLIGDPGAGKSLTYNQRIFYYKNNRLFVEEIGKFINNLIEKNKNKVKKIEDMEILELNEEILVPSITKDFKFELKKIKAVMRHKPYKEIIKIETETGREVFVTKDHSLLKFNGEKVIAVKGEDIKKGDLIPLLKKINSFNYLDFIEIGDKKLELNYGFGYFIGYFLGDGSLVSSNNRLFIEVTLTSKEKLNRIKEFLEKYNFKFWRSKNNSKLIINDKDFINWVKDHLHKDFIEKTYKKGVKTKLKRLNFDFLNANEEFLKGIIEGLIDSDGYIDKGAAEISLVNENLIKDLELILQRLGVIYTKRKQKKKYKNKEVGVYKLRIFYFDFNSNKNDFKEKLNKFDKIVIPKSFLKSLKEANIDKNKKSEFRGKVYRAYCSREYAKKILFFVKDEKLSQIVNNNNIFWDKVKKIEVLNMNEIENNNYVYDLEVEGTNNFVAEGVFVHNSQLLKYIQKIAPKSRFVSGKGASAAGLTATVTKDDYLKTWSVEAGVLVLASGGVALIDELDKIGKEDVQALYEAMEQQTVSIAKASINATLKAECSILAAANPKYGRFDPYLSIAEQINLPPPLLTRFDLIFTVLDVPDTKKDRAIARHILKTHRLEGAKPEIDLQLLKKWVVYARQNIKPKMSEKAAQLIEEYYTRMRSAAIENGKISSIPITTRQLEAIIRLSEACARVRLSNEVSVEDAQRAINLVESSLKRIGYDPETGKIDVDRITGVSTSQRNKMILVRELIKRLNEEKGMTPVSFSEIAEKLKQEGIDEKELEEIIQKLKRKGDIYEPRNGYFMVMEY